MISIEAIIHHQSRMLYWTRLKLSKDTKTTYIYICVTHEFIEDHYKGANQEKIDSWSNEVLKKWTNLQNELDDQFYDIPIHYDTYSDTKEGEANSIDFLIKLAKT